MKSKIIGRRQLLIGTLAASLCIAVFVNWYYTKPKELEQPEPEITNSNNLGEAQYVNGTKTVDENDYFSTARLARTKAHDAAKEYIENILSDSNSDEETKSSAREQLVTMSSLIKSEADIENLIRAQINNDCLVTLSLESIEVILPKGTITDDILIKIKDIVISKTKFSAEYITIIELK